MQILEHISPEELQSLQESARVALVLMGGGAKGAYEVGVWRVLWNLRIRKFSVISGTSVGALNALLIASANPEIAEKLWDDVIAAGVLERKRSPLWGVAGLLCAHLLIFSSLVIAFMLTSLAVVLLVRYLPAAFHGQVISPTVALFLACTGGLLLLCWLTARQDASFLNWISTGGYALPLFSKHPKRRIQLANWLCLPSAAACLVAVGYLGGSKRHLPGWTFWLIPIFWALLVILRWNGLKLLHHIVHVWPLFEREALDAAIRKLAAENRIFSNCSGPVVATLTRHAVYRDPYRLHPLAQRHRYDPFTEEYLPRNWHGWTQAEPLAEWVPEYIDLRNTSDIAWVLSASSAIPFAFRAISRQRKDPDRRREVFVDGGVVDNLPLLPAVEAKPEYIIVVAVNARDMLGDEATIREKVQEDWRRSFFSKEQNEAAANEMRRQWIESLRADYFAEREELSKALAKEDRSCFRNFMPLSPGPSPPLPPFGPEAGDAKIIFIRPSAATSLNLPVLGLLTGTMRFDPEYKKKLIELGVKDARAVFGHPVE